MPKNISGAEANRLRILRKRASFRQRGLCYWCDEPMKPTLECSPGDPRMLTGDHLIRLADGGQTVPGNIVAACRKCNNERSYGPAPEDVPQLVRPPGIAYSTGEEPASPFEALRVLREETDGACS